MQAEGYCRVCGKPFVKTQSNRFYCAPFCERPCQVCGEVFAPKSKATQKYCSLACAAKSPRNRSNAVRGPAHYAWKGAAAPATTQRQRAQAMYPLDGVTCEQDGCEAPATDRHHVSGDTNDNRRENLQFVCRRHHMEIDGRLAAFKALDRSQTKPSQPCTNCGVLAKPRRKGRCRNCAEYLRRHGVERTPENSRKMLPSESPRKVAA